jgi:uncharacterized cupredoxin-like copper-binding protein
MSAVTEETKAKQSAAAESEAHQLEVAAAERGGRNLTLLVVFAALAALVGGLVALGLSDGLGHNTTVMPMNPNGAGGHMNGTSISGQMPGAMHGAGQATARTSKSAGSIPVVSSTLGEYYIHPNMTSVRAGKIEFSARNVGQVTHELMVERMPMKMDGPGQPNEDAAQGMIDDMGPGASGKMTLALQPGMYMLFCNLPGHYAAGQHTMLRVTGS